MTRTRSSARLRVFAEKVQGAIDAGNRADVEAALAELYPNQLPDAAKSAKKNLAESLRTGDESGIRKGLAVAPAAGIKPGMRSHGDDADAA